MRFVPLPLIFAALLTGIFSGLWRAGFTLLDLSQFSMNHGALMTGAFLGSLIALERAVIVKKWFAYLVPLCGGLSLFAFYYSPAIGFLLLCGASLGLIIILSWIYLKYKEWHHLILILGSSCWLIGNLLLLSGNVVFFSVPWWMGFFLLTITAERIELARFLLLRSFPKTLILSLLGLAFVSLLLPFHDIGRYVLGFSFASLALALIKYDMARKNAKAHGIHRFSGVALILSYVWLLAAGIGIIFSPFDGLFYDGIVHTYFLGFVFSMVFAHGPMILPTILKAGSHLFHSILWVWLVLHHLGLLARVVSDIANYPYGRLVSSGINAMAIIAFLFTMVILVARKKMNLVHRN